jgi:hypothetical protein
LPTPNTSRTQAQAEYASLMARKPDSDEAREAARRFFFVKMLDALRDGLNRSPLPFTDEQRQALADLLVGAR